MMRKRRGQSLLLMALTMLLLVIMVTITLSIGMRAREKIELQTMADAAAYSNAVASARVYNTISVWNRAQVSHMVVLAGAQSHISYSSWYLASLQTTAIAGAAAATACGLACANPWLACMCPSCVNTGRVALAFQREFNQVRNRYRSLDSLAGAEGRVLQTRARLYGTMGQGLYALHLVNTAQGLLSPEVLRLAVPDAGRRGEYSFLRAADIGVTALELGTRARQSGSRGPYPSLPAAHGSRESEFIRDRGISSVIPPVRPTMLFAQNQGLGVPPIASGGAYFGTGRHNTNERDARESWACDHGVSSSGLVFGGCIPWFIPPVPTTAHVRSTHSGDNSDQHRWSPGGSQHNGSEANVHSLGNCGSSCPSVWIVRQEFNINPDNVNENNNPRDQWRQPKHLVGLERNYSARRVQDPWNLAFNFRALGGSGAQVDVGRQNTGGMNRQLAFAAGMTYYHRHMDNVGLDWQEPPNFFNPFWRATLVPADIDDANLAHANLVAAASDANLATGMLLLRTLGGFRGIQ